MALSQRGGAHQCLLGFVRMGINRIRLSLSYNEIAMRILVILAVLLFSAPAFSASFDCTKASNFVEKEICSDPVLGNLDEALANNYKEMLSSDFGGSVSSLKADQRKWIANRNKCTTRDCLISAYRKRVDETCDYGVVSGVHPDCVDAKDVEQEISSNKIETSSVQPAQQQQQKSTQLDNKTENKSDKPESYKIIYGNSGALAIATVADSQGCLVDVLDPDVIQNPKVGHIRVDEIRFKKGCPIQTLGVLYGVGTANVLPIIPGKSDAFQFIYREGGRAELFEKLKHEDFATEPKRIALESARKEEAAKSVINNPPTAMQHDANYGPKVRACIQPGVTYPSPSRTGTANPTVEYRVQLSADGRVQGISLVRTSGNSGFDAAVARAIQGCNPFPKPSVGNYESSIVVDYGMYQWGK